MRTRRESVLGYCDGWSVLVTSALHHRVNEPTVENFHSIGVALGRLHTLPITSIDDPALPIGIGWFHSEDALREALHYLSIASASIPRPWHSLVKAFHTTLQTIQHTSLPRTLIHGDPFIDKAAMTDDGRSITLREWHSGGLGVAVLDLGRLLYACHLNQHEVWPYFLLPFLL